MKGRMGEREGGNGQGEPTASPTLLGLPKKNIWSTACVVHVTPSLRAPQVRLREIMTQSGERTNERKEGRRTERREQRRKTGRMRLELI